MIKNIKDFMESEEGMLKIKESMDRAKKVIKQLQEDRKWKARD